MLRDGGVARGLSSASGDAAGALGMLLVLPFSLPAAVRKRALNYGPELGPEGPKPGPDSVEPTVFGDDVGQLGFWALQLADAEASFVDPSVSSNDVCFLEPRGQRLLR